MTAHECLMHSWLRGDYSPRLEPIDMMRYIPIRDKIRAKYKEWEKFLLPIGRLAEYSSLRKLQRDKYRIHDTHFGEFLRVFSAPTGVRKVLCIFFQASNVDTFY